MWEINLLFLLIIQISSCFKLPKMFGGRPLTGFNPRFRTFNSENYDNDGGRMFEQILDHFDPANNVTWKQQYWSNMEFAKPNGPQFLMMGQEGQGSSMDVIGPLHKRWAQNVSAGIWSLEHRFYGNSQPFEEQTVENMKYLSSRQYLGDVANFIRTQNRNLNLTNPKWIVFGGSYAGSLALWFRQLYPELAAGAVGSSGPIQPVLDFYEYNQIVENSIRHRDPKCAKNAKIAFKQLEELMEYVNGRDELNIVFKNNLAMLNITSDEIQNFYLHMIEIFEEKVQYDCLPSCNDGIEEICRIMNIPSSNKVMNLGLIHSYFISKDNPQESYQNVVEYLNYTLYENLFRASVRSWFWQTCNEFGFYTSTNSGSMFFGSKISLNYYIDLCMDVFGDEFNVDHIKAGIANTLKLYGGIENYNGTNVIAPRGSIDPWSALALKTSNDSSVIPYLIDEGSHCSDMVAPNEFDNESLKNLRALILQNIKIWIGISPIHHATTNIKKHGKKLFVSEIDWNRVSNYKPSNQSRSFRIHKLLHQNILREKFYKNAQFIDIDENKISQPLDHFNKTNGKIWNQRFWNNSAFYKEGGPIFLMLGGEDDGGASFINNENSPFSIWAKQYGADAYFLEHRGYGFSLPTNTSSVENLKFISSEQALADIANFIDAINIDKNRPNSKWITFGGSYPGTLSAWFREKYPHHTVGAVASSAPMLPKIDFFEYNQVVENFLYEYNPKCAANLKAAFADLEFQLYNIKGRKLIKKLFHVSLSGKSPNIYSIYEFLYEIIGQWEEAVQYGYNFVNRCKVMTNDTNTPLENLSHMANIWKNEEKFIKQNDDNSWSVVRTWIWQTCTEFGWYQTTDMGRNIFGTAVPVDFYIEYCIRKYGKNITDIAAGVDYTLKNYGGLDNYNATNIVFINGSYDPWHAISLYTNNTLSSGITSILINGTTHCEDMNDPKEEDSVEMKAARQKIGQLIEIWLK